MVEFQWLLTGCYWGLICIPRREVHSWNLDPLAGIIDNACFFLPSTWLLEVFSLSGALLVQLLLLTFFPFEPCNAHFSSGATVVDGVKQKGSVWWLSASYMRIRKSRWSKGMWPCPCNFRVKSCDPRSTNHPQQSPSHLPKRNSSDNRPKPWLRSTPKMSQWDSTALANNCFNKSLVRPSSWLATVLLKWADPTTRFCKAGTLKSNLPNIPLRAHCSDCKFSFTACTNCPLRIKKSSGIATANPDSATPTTLHPKVSKRCKSIGSHSCMAMCDQVPARKDEISIPWRTEPGFHDKPEMRLRSITQSPGMHLMLHCLLCIMETKNFGDFCGMASASAVDGNYI